MEKLHYLVIHCTDTPAGRFVTRKDIEQWHLVERGWSKLGYSDMVHLDGSIENLTPYNEDDYVENFEITNGTRGYNTRSRHVVYVGGGSGIDTRTIAQKEALEKYVMNTIKNHPTIKVVAHHQLSTKKCPSFNVPEWLQSICVTSKNILK